MSYSRKDDDSMRRTTAFLRGKGLTVWVDNEKLTPGTPIWEAEIEKAIRTASAVVIFMSPDSKDSEWVRREITLADQYRKRIFPVLVRGDEDSSITLRLITRQYVDLRANEAAGLHSLLAGLSSYLGGVQSQLEQKTGQEVERLGEENRRVQEQTEAERKAGEEAERVARAKLEAERPANEKRRLHAKAKTTANAREDAQRPSAHQVDEQRIAEGKKARPGSLIPQLSFWPLAVTIFIIILASSLLGLYIRQNVASNITPIVSTTEVPIMSTMTDSTVNSQQPTTIGGHLAKPAEVMPVPVNWIDDVESSGTGSEGRAPYGDSYRLNRFERPFQRDMTYIADLDIHKFSLSQDADWYYVSIELIGNNPNNSLGINYGVEIDLTGDGFGDFIVWAHPPYTTSWQTSTVQVLKDSDHDTGGIISHQSDAVFTGNGYDTIVFDGETGQDDDPDLAWVRFSDGQPVTIQFSFKKSLIGLSFAFGAVSDAGPRDLSKFDYSDYFTEVDAGSPVRENEYYPLGSLYAIDNTCWEAYGVEITSSLRLCSPIISVQPTKGGGAQSSGGSSLSCSTVFEQQECQEAGCTCITMPGPCQCP